MSVLIDQTTRVLVRDSYLKVANKALGDANLQLFDVNGRLRLRTNELEEAQEKLEMYGRGVYLDPPGVGFSPGVDLSAPNDLALSPGANADLYRLDPATGTWSAVGMGTVDGTGTVIQISGTINGGGVFAFATTVNSAASVSGRVVAADGAAVSSVLVRADQSRALTASNGTFTLSGLPAVDGASAIRTVAVEFAGGREFWPITASSTTSLAGGAVTIPDVTLETFLAGTLQLLQITRGRTDPNRRIGVSGSDGVFGLAAHLQIGDTTAESTFLDTNKGFLGFLTSRPKDDSTVFLTQNTINFSSVSSIAQVTIFSSEISWVGFGDTTTVYVADDFGTGPVNQAGLAEGFVQDGGFIGFTPQAGLIVANQDVGGQATASVETNSDGVTVTSAFSMINPLGVRTELPLERANPDPLGSFDPYGLIAGSLTNTGAGPDRAVSSSRIWTVSDWYDEVFDDRSRSGDMPLEIDPASTGGTVFELGLPPPEGNLTAVEGKQLNNFADTCVIFPYS